MLRIRLIPQNPLSVGFGWLEIQAERYLKMLKDIFPNADVGYFSWSEKEFDVLHIIGIHGGLSAYAVGVLKDKWVKIIVSPVFYLSPGSLFDFRRPWVYKLCSYIPYHIAHSMKAILSAADMILPNSPSEAKQLKYIFWVPSKVVPNGVDRDYYEWISGSEFTEAHDLKPREYFLSVSHIEPRKNQLRLISAYLQSNSLYPLYLIGEYRGNYASYHQAVKALIDSSAWKVRHIPWLPSWSSMLKSAFFQARMHFLPSYLETPWLSNLQAGLAGVPLCVGRCSPVEEYFWLKATYVDPFKEQELVKIFEYSSVHEFFKHAELATFICHSYTWQSIAKEIGIEYYSQNIYE